MSSLDRFFLVFHIQYLLSDDLWLALWWPSLQFGYAPTLTGACPMPCPVATGQGKAWQGKPTAPQRPLFQVGAYFNPVRLIVAVNHGLSGFCRLGFHGGDFMTVLHEF